MFFSAAKANFVVFVVHIPGTANSLADALSRLQVELFHELHPKANKRPSAVPTPHWGH